MLKNDCHCRHIPQDNIDRILYTMPSSEQIDRLGELFKLLGDPSRLRIIHILMHQELCVADLASLAGLQQPAVSQNLKLLRLMHLVKYRKDGKTVYYTLDDEHVGQLFQLALHHVMELI